MKRRQVLTPSFAYNTDAICSGQFRRGGGIAFAGKCGFPVAVTHGNLVKFGQLEIRKRMLRAAMSWFHHIPFRCGRQSQRDNTGIGTPDKPSLCKMQKNEVTHDSTSVQQ